MLLTCFALPACKNSPPSCLSGSKYEASAIKGDTYYGGFLRIYSLDHTTTDCEVMIMPQNLAATSFHRWDNLTLYTARSCLEVDQESAVSLLLYTGPSPTQAAETYIELPLTSPYLQRLAEVRSEFMEAYRTMASPRSGRIKLKVYETMMAQIHRLESINFQRSLREHGWIKPKEKLPAPTQALFKSMQTDLCAHGVLSGAVRPPLEDERYTKLQAYRIDPEAHKHLGCYVFSDLMAFDAKVELNQAERTALATIWPPELPPFSIPRSGASDELAQLSRRQNLRPSRDIELLTRRITEAGAMAETFERVSPAEYKFFQALSSAWLQLPLAGHKAAGGIAKELGNNALNFMLRGKSAIGSPLESYINDVIPSSRLMLAGNVLSAGPTGNALQFHSRIINHDAQNNPTFKQHTFIDQQLYALFVATEPPRGDEPRPHHPLTAMTSGSFLLYDGHPIATLLVMNKAYVPRSDAAISVYAYASYRHSEPSESPTPHSTAQLPQQPAAPASEGNPQRHGTNTPLPPQSPAGTPGAGGGVAGGITTATTTAEDVAAEEVLMITPAVQPISDQPSLRGEWSGSTTTTTSCPVDTQVCDPDQPGCADDCTYCAAGAASKPGCTATELTSYRCQAGSAGCSDTGVKCTVDPRAAGCGYSADACERGTSLLGGLFGGAGRCPATIAPVADEEVSPFNCGS